MEEQEVISTASEGGAPADPGVATASEPGAQAPAQGNSSDASQVEPGSGEPSSTGGQKRQSNSPWAASRVLEKQLSAKMEKLLEDKFGALMERFGPPASPAAAKPAAPEVPAEYKELASWLESYTKSLMEQNASGIMSKVDQNIGKKLGVREARSYLHSKVGTDPEKLAQIQEIMDENMLGYAAVERPYEAVQKAVSIWEAKRGKERPNAPKAAHLAGGPTGGAPGKPAGVPSLTDIKKLQDRLTQPMTEEDKTRLVGEIESMTKAVLSASGGR